MKMLQLEECCEILDSMRVPITAKDRKKGPYPYYGANGVQDYVADYIFDDDLVLLAEDGGNFGSDKRPIAYKVSGKCWVNNHAHVLKPKAGMNVDYLCYSLMFYKVDGMVNGATRMKLTQAAMRRMLIPSRTIEGQKAIVRLLNRIQMLIKVEKEQLKKYDELIKSRFVEMFGYDIKDCDQSEQVKEIANVRVGIVIQPTQYYTSKEEVGIKAFRSANVRPFLVNNSDWVYFDPESHSRMSKTHIHSNEVLIVRSGANLGQSCVVPEEYEGSNAIDILIVKVDEEKILPGFFCAFVNFPMGRMQILDGQRGGAQKHLNVGVFEKARIPIPSIEKQREFVSFVEAIDKSKFATQKALTETQQLFDSLMQKYFG